MTTFELTRNETWVLSSLLSLPIQHGSVLGEWLGSDDIPDVDLIQSWFPECLGTLERKKYIKKEEVTASELMTVLLLASVGQQHIFTGLRTKDQAVSTRFLLAGSGAIQYGYDPEKIIFHSPIQREQLLALLLPDWVKIASEDQSVATLPLNAFLVFKQSCQQQSISDILNSDHTQGFSLADLESSFKMDNGWLDVYNALGFKGYDPLSEVLISDQLDLLNKMGWVDKIAPEQYKIGSSGSTLNEAFSDPHQVSITFSFSSVNPQVMTSCAFLIGSGRLFRIDFSGEFVIVSQMQSREHGLDWIRLQIKIK